MDGSYNRHWRNAYRILIFLKEKGYFGDGRVMLKWIFKKQDIWIDVTQDCFGYGNEHPGSIKGGEFLTS